MEVKKVFLTFFLFGAIASCLVESAVVEGKKQPHKKVLILGAGLSGITAAKTLMNNGIKDFLVLEGQDYIGGRIRQRPIAEYKIEAGANWIHFALDDETKPIWTLKKRRREKGVFSKYGDFIIRNEEGVNVTNEEYIHHFEKTAEHIESAQELRAKLHKTPISARTGFALLGWKPKTPAERVIEYFDVDFEDAKRPEMVPFESLFVKEPDFFVTDQRGVINLYEGIYKQFRDKIKLNTRVKKIKYGKESVEVTTSDGEIYTADFALSTFSNGVLASDMVTFDPPLPGWKQEAIWKLPMSVYTKIFLKFPYKFWDDNEYILLAARQRGYFPVFQNLERPGMFPGSGLLLITVTEDEGRRIEKQSFEATKKEIVKMLRGVYGQRVPEPTDIYYHRWSLNPFVRGAYSDPTIGYTSETFENIGKNLDNLYFSGEGTSEDWYGYMQGSYLTGWKKAKLIAKALKKCN